MVVSLELFKGKKLSDNTFPKMIRISSNGKNIYKSTGISTKEKNWNKTKKKIGCRDTSYKEKNIIINQSLKRVIDRIQYFEEKGFEYDFNFILSDKDISSYNGNIIFNNIDFGNFLNIIIARIQSFDKIKTKENYQAFYNKFKNLYGDYLNINELNQDFANGFRTKIDEAGFSANHKNSLIKCFTSCYKYGVGNGWITRPTIISLKKFPYQPENKDISHEDFTKIINCFKKEYSINGNEIGNFKALAIFILDIAFQGLAPVDLANIKIKDIQLCRISKIDKDIEQYNNDSNYRNYIDDNQETKLVIKINTYRAKTGSFVPICCDAQCVKDIILYFANGKSKEDYLLDCFSINKERTEKQRNNRCGNYYLGLKKELNTILKTYCNTFDLEQIPEITYYSARHAFINAVYKMPNIDVDLIRKMVGHRRNTLEKSYLNKPTNWEQSTVIYNLFNQSVTIRELEFQRKGYNNDRIVNDWRKLHNLLDD